MAGTVHLPERPGSQGQVARAKGGVGAAIIEVVVLERQGGQATVDTVRLTDGRQVTLRRAGAGDLAPVRAMHARCSPATLHRRYLTAAGGTDAHLRRLLTPAQGCALLAEAGPGLAVALANVLGEGVQAEVALLVEDAWQRSGLGTALLRRAVAIAGVVGFDAVVVYTGVSNDPMLRTLRRLYPDARAERDGGLVTVRLRPERTALPAPTGG